MRWEAEPGGRGQVEMTYLDGGGKLGRGWGMADEGDVELVVFPFPCCSRLFAFLREGREGGD